MAVFSYGCGRETKHVLGFDLFHYAFEREGGDMMTFIHNVVTMVRNEVGHFAYLLNALQHGDVEIPGRLLPGPDGSYRFPRNIQ